MMLQTHFVPSDIIWRMQSHVSYTVMFYSATQSIRQSTKGKVKTRKTENHKNTFLQGLFSLDRPYKPQENNDNTNKILNLLEEKKIDLIFVRNFHFISLTRFLNNGFVFVFCQQFSLSLFLSSPVDQWFCRLIFTTQCALVVALLRFRFFFCVWRIFVYIVEIYYVQNAISLNVLTSFTKTHS